MLSQNMLKNEFAQLDRCWKVDFWWIHAMHFNCYWSGPTVMGQQRHGSLDDPASQLVTRVGADQDVIEVDHIENVHALVEKPFELVGQVNGFLIAVLAGTFTDKGFYMIDLLENLLIKIIWVSSEVAIVI